MKIKFFGGANSVTGACYLIETKNKKFIVDCGMFQSGRYLDERNYGPFPFNVKEIDFAFITHAHIDHIGRIPKLIKDGFSGKIFATKPTRDLAEISLLDSAHLIESEAKRENYEPFYTTQDVEESMKFFEGIDYYQKIDLGDGVYCIFKDAGHILGSSIIEVYAEGKKIVFSGDLGNQKHSVFLNSFDVIEDADYMVVESAYGNRIHEDVDKRREILEDSIEDTVTNGGVLMIPAFAMERTQEILYEIDGLIEHNRIPEIPAFLDSPLAIKSTRIYRKYIDYYNQKALKELGLNTDKIFSFPRLKFTLTTEESKRINDILPPKIIIAGSGMSQGGRILHHERRYLPDPKSMLLIIGYQVAGSLGRRILDGAKEVKIFGEVVPVRAKVKAIGGYSAHADQKGLFDWVSYSKKTLKRVFVVQGEEAAANALAVLIKDYLGVQAIAPFYKEEFIL